MACSSFGPFAMLHLWDLHKDIVHEGEEHVLALEVYRAGWGLFHAQLPIMTLAQRPVGRPWEHKENAPDWQTSTQASFIYLRRVLHADKGCHSFHCAQADGPLCTTEQHQLLTGLDYRAGKEVPSAWSRWLAQAYPETT